MKKSILNVGKALNKAEQKKVTGGEPFQCAYYRQYNLCFGPLPGCQPCGRIDDYVNARECGLFTHVSCEDGGGFSGGF
ncbi:hypothetical protein [uncultured Tenacibaculum sp.]|uniref:hypothetical protein n=1 Tax=uncultured Tenacibaculum sp. TaxID=174713 RepID=UPI002619CB14|nr:hypothetical protein [uncultured Tenacibaculum sp.]